MSEPKTMAEQFVEDQLTASEAVVCFAAWLTTRKEILTIGSSCDASRVAELVQLFNDSQKFSTPREDFHKRGYPYPDA